MHQVLVSIATWMSASKSYDLVLGDRRKEKEISEHLQEKETLKAEVEKLKNGSTSDETSEDDPTLDQKLRDILQGKGDE